MSQCDPVWRDVEDAVPYNGKRITRAAGCRPYEGQTPGSAEPPSFKKRAGVNYGRYHKNTGWDTHFPVRCFSHFICRGAHCASAKYTEANGTSRTPSPTKHPHAPIQNPTGRAGRVPYKMCIIWKIRRRPRAVVPTKGKRPVLGENHYLISVCAAAACYDEYSRACAQTVCARCDHFSRVIGVFYTTRCFYPDIGAHGFPHQGDILYRCTSC